MGLAPATRPSQGFRCISPVAPSQAKDNTKAGSGKPGKQEELRRQARENLAKLREQAKKAKRDADQLGGSQDAEAYEEASSARKTSQKPKEPVDNAIEWPDGAMLTRRDGSRLSVKKADSLMYSSSYTCLDKVPDQHFKDWLEKMSPSCSRVKLDRCSRQQLFCLLHLAVGVLPSDKLPSLLGCFLRLFWCLDMEGARGVFSC